MQGFRAPRATGAGYRCTMERTRRRSDLPLKAAFYTRHNKLIPVTRAPRTVPAVIPITVAVALGTAFHQSAR